jgi:hypothetical protein
VADDDLHSLSERLLALTQKVEADEDVQALAKQVLALTGKVEAVESRMLVVERLETQLEESALQTTRALEEISRHWDAVSNRPPARERARINGGRNFQLH